MSQVEQTIEVNVPVSTAYNQWTQFESFPSFMKNVEEVRQLDDTRTHWVVDVAGSRQEFDAEITEQIPDTRIAWKSTSGPQHAGAVDFHRLDDERTQLMVVMDTHDEGLVQKAAAATGIVESRVHADLDRFKEMIESRGTEEGGWRGEVRPEG